MMFSKAQAAMEYMILIGFILAILIPLVIIFYGESASISSQVRSEQLRVVGQKIIDNAENVYYLGEPSKVLIKIFLPGGIKSIEINPKSITFTIYSETGPSDVVIPSNVNLSGSIRMNMGYQYLSVENKGGYVNISEK